MRRLIKTSHCVADCALDSYRMRKVLALFGDVRTFRIVTAAPINLFYQIRHIGAHRNVVLPGLNTVIVPLSEAVLRLKS